MNYLERWHESKAAWNAMSAASRAQYKNDFVNFLREREKAHADGDTALAQLRQMEASRPPIPEPRISHAERAAGLRQLQQITGGQAITMPSMGQAPSMALDDAALMAEWSRSPSLQHEFPTAGCYAAYAKAEASGLVKVHSAGTGLQRHQIAGR